MARMKRISRMEAGEKGLRLYYTGEPCVNGHTAARFVSTGGCSECVAVRRRLPEVQEHYRKRQAEKRQQWREIRQKEQVGNV